MITVTRDPEQDVRPAAPDTAERFTRRGKAAIHTAEPWARAVGLTDETPAARAAERPVRDVGPTDSAPADLTALVTLVQALGDAADLDALDALERPSRSPVELAALAAKIRAGDYVVDADAVAGALLDRLVTGRPADWRLE